MRARPAALAGAGIPWGLLVVLCIFVLLSVGNSLLVPPFEGPDEHMHYAYVRHLALGHGIPPRLPVAAAPPPYSPLQEASQPPLYYALAALATVAIPGADRVESALVRNPYHAFGVPNYVLDNENLWLRSPASGTLEKSVTAAVRAARGVSILLGLGAVIGVYQLALVCFAGQRSYATCSAAWVAFNPVFVFTCSMVSNDSAAACLSAWVLWFMAIWVRSGPSLLRALGWGMCLGLAALCKVNVLGLLPVCALGYWWGAMAAPDRALRLALPTIGIAALCAGWWYVLGAVRYGDPLGVSPHIAAPWVRVTASLPKLLMRTLDTDFVYWGLLGSSGMQPPPVLFRGITYWARVGLLGVAVYVWRERQALHRVGYLMLLLSLSLLMMVASLMWWLRWMPQGLGRLLFPAAGSIAILLAMGWQGWLPRQWREKGLLAMTGGLLTYAVVVLLLVVRPAYARPAQLSAAGLAACRQQPNVRFGGSARLACAEPSPAVTTPGGWTWVKLCWEALAPFDRDYEEFVHLVGPGDYLAAVRHTHTGLGRFPTSAWQPGDAFCDIVRLRLHPDAFAPAVYNVEIGLVEPETGRRLKATDERGAMVDPVIVGPLKVLPVKTPALEAPLQTQARVGDWFVLSGYALEPAAAAPGEPFAVTLYWRTHGRPNADYTVFVHMLDGDGGLVAQSDSMPVEGWYPTSYWDAGEQVSDRHVLVIPRETAIGCYHLFAGMYHPVSLVRLPAYAEDGVPLPDGIVPLGEVNVLP